MKAKKIYRVTDINFDGSAYRNMADGYLTWRYGGKEYWAQGEFYVDNAGYLYHTFSTPRGIDKELKIKVI